jgi:Transposase DDE domain
VDVRSSSTLLDGGYLRLADIEHGQQQGVELFVPPKPARQPCHRGRELEPKPGDSEAVRAWKRRMASAEGKEIYRQRAATSETVNADLRSYRGLTPLSVRGLAKIKRVALWCALAYNVMHFGSAAISEGRAPKRCSGGEEVGLRSPAPALGSSD